MNASIAVQIALRSTEQVVKVSTPQLAEVKVTKHTRECFFVVVNNREQSYELA
jgi:hypothetical protein